MSAPHDTRRSASTRALARGLCLWLAVMVVTAGGGLLTRTYLPGVDGTVRALLVVEVLFALALLAAPFVGSWRELGVNRRAEWRHTGLLVVPLVVAVSPLVLGFRSVGTDLLLVLVVGYVLTGVTEELVWRGFALRLLAPLGTTRAVVVGAALFGTAHLANVFFRDSTGLVLAQAWGAFCFGLAYGALRVRTDTIVPLMALHALTDLAAAVGNVPKIPVLVAEDVVLLAYGVALLTLRPRKDTPMTDNLLLDQELSPVPTGAH
ncbi:CPBP family intramembrane glutamic endopeptidase [Nocardioides sp.]|uniref:CPBP family intramembrane glutamic endopeptidase n=1 Tax=Nocardioides sp. TaxID=35761 RepID=UPI003783FFD0